MLFRSLAMDPVHDWAAAEDCGAVVLFSGPVRDHAEGRSGVTALEYEAYEEQVVPAFGSIVAELRARFPDARRVAIIHRTGRVPLGESTVVVAVSSAHRPVAFEAARFAIDALKQSAPIWKKEIWSGGEAWGTGAHELVPPSAVVRITSLPFTGSLKVKPCCASQKARPSRKTPLVESVQVSCHVFAPSVVR